MEKDNEISGSGNSYTTYFRQYDPRLGRWKTPDPVIHPWESPYAGYANNPIYYTDPQGDFVGCALAGLGLFIAGNAGPIALGGAIIANVAVQIGDGPMAQANSMAENNLRFLEEFYSGWPPKDKYQRKWEKFEGNALQFRDKYANRRWYEKHFNQNSGITRFPITTKISGNSSSNSSERSKSSRGRYRKLEIMNEKTTRIKFEYDTYKKRDKIEIKDSETGKTIWESGYIGEKGSVEIEIESNSIEIIITPISSISNNSAFEYKITEYDTNGIKLEKIQNVEYQKMD